MSRAPSGPETIKRRPTNNVYTVMVMVAFVALAVTVGWLWMTNVELTGDEQPAEGNKNPFFVLPAND